MNYSSLQPVSPLQELTCQMGSHSISRKGDIPTFVPDN